VVAEKTKSNSSKHFFLPYKVSLCIAERNAFNDDEPGILASLKVERNVMVP
jgi:hypothetical protein